MTGEINTRAAFLARNLATLEQAREEEAKLRRAGLVVDEDWQARWYLDRLPPHVHNAQALDAWYAQAAAGSRSARWNGRCDDLLAGEGSDAERFPTYFALGDARLAVHYRFEPGRDRRRHDVAVPLHLLNALDPARLSWLAPGFVADKAAALIRAAEGAAPQLRAGAGFRARVRRSACRRPDADVDRAARWRAS